MSAFTYRKWQLISAVAAMLILLGAAGRHSAKSTVKPPQTQSLSGTGAQPACNCGGLVRRDLSSMTAAQIAAFRAAVLAMMAQDCKAGHTAPTCEQEVPDNGTLSNDMLKESGWKYQAYIHGSPFGDARPAWNSCQHATWFFLSWHRMELFFFERFLQKASGNANLTLPYWNFGTDRTLPASFLAQTVSGSPNALWWPFRSARANGGMPFPETQVTANNAFKQTAFFSNVLGEGGLSFGGGASQTGRHSAANTSGGAGQLEIVPHNAMHGAIGLPGNSRSMIAVAGAGLDPIFWPIHANIDRAWACWQMKHPGTEPKSEAWLKTLKFTFIDVQDATPGYKEVEMSGENIVNTASITVNGVVQRSYTYDDACKGFLPLPAPEELSAELLGATQSTVSFAPLATPLTATAAYDGILVDDPMTVSIPLSAAMKQRIAAAVPNGAPVNSVFLTIDGVAADEPSGAAYEIYLSLPRRALAESSSENFVSYLPFFGIGEHHNHGSEEHRHGATFNYDLTDVIRRLIANDAWNGDDVSITLSNSYWIDTAHTIPPPASALARARFRTITLTVQ